MTLVLRKLNDTFNCCHGNYILRIQFPDPHSRYRTSQVSIIGSFDGALEARYRLMVMYTSLYGMVISIVNVGLFTGSIIV